MKNNREQRNFSWILVQSKVARAVLVVLVFISVVNVGVRLSSAYILMFIMDIATGIIDFPLSIAILLGILATFGMCVTIFLRGVFAQKANQKINRGLRAYIMRSFHRLPYSEAQKKHSAETMVLLSDDSLNISRCVPQIADEMLTTVALGLGSIIAIFLLNWQLGLIISFVTPIVILVMKAMTPALTRIMEKRKAAEDDVRKSLSEGVTKTLLFRAYDMLEYVMANYNKRFSHAEKAALKMTKLGALHSNISHFFAGILMFITYGVGAIFIGDGILTVGTLVAIVMLMGNVSVPFMYIGVYMNVIADASASANRIRKITDFPEEVSEVKKEEIKNISSVFVNGVNFAYDGESVLKNANLDGKIGDVVGIIGKSGSGKSTLTKIIMGLYKADSGSVSLNDLQTENLLPYIAYVPSTDYLFYGSVIDNIAMSDKNPDKTRVQKAASLAGVDDFILSLPDGYNTIVGEGENALSSGQGQRIAIARALYTDKPILIFDEPTSNLDTASIDRLHSSIKEISKDKICIIVTHDVATRDICNKIYEIEQGVMSEPILAYS
ncbi:MAG: ABC transporter ATP-binding protein/permease [Turicibacter sp.]|nr:ABC transporter ATP-binding protein/permease [Turicibacter sp.]